MPLAAAAAGLDAGSRSQALALSATTLLLKVLLLVPLLQRCLVVEPVVVALVVGCVHLDVGRGVAEQSLRLCRLFVDSTLALFAVVVALPVCV